MMNVVDKLNAKISLDNIMKKLLLIYFFIRIVIKTKKIND